MQFTPNWFAYIALIAWPLVVVSLYASRPAAQATLWAVLGAYLLLPVGTRIKIEGVPQFDKTTIPNLAVLFCCLVLVRRPFRPPSGAGLVEVLIGLLIIGPFVTSELNQDPIVYGDITLPAETHYDALSAVVAEFLFLIPFFLGRRLLRSAADNEQVLRVLAVAGLAYSLPMLFEVRMSPQLHTWIYGYFPHEFAQQVRDGGFRPVVFLGHGLLVAFFASTSVVAATALWRTRTRVVPVWPGAVATYLGAMLVLCKSVGALVYGAALTPLVRFATPKLQLRVAAVLVSIALAYPMLRTFDLVPTTFLLDAAQSVNEDRALSLKIRFDQEKALLDHASERLWFGWGRWNRSRVFTDWGQDVSITDGRWIIAMGTFGLVGFIAEFGLLAFPVFRAVRALKYAESEQDRVFLAALTLIIAISMIDMLPNSPNSPWTWLLAGALLGRAEQLHAAAGAARPALRRITKDRAIIR